MAGISLASLETLDDAVLTNRFLLLLTLPSAIADQQATRDLALRCQQAVVPGVQTEPVTVGLHGHEVVFRGRTIFSKTMAFNFLETSRGVVQQRIRDWKEVVVGTQSGNGAYKEEYAGTATLQVLDTTGAVSSEIRIYRVWPTDIPEVQLDGASSTPYLVPVTFSFDYFIRSGTAEDPAGTPADYV